MSGTVKVVILMINKTAEFILLDSGSDGKASAYSAGDLGLIPGSERSPGEGKGYLLQYSVLENSMDYIVQGVAKSQTQLSDFKAFQGSDKWN